MKSSIERAKQEAAQLEGKNWSGGVQAETVKGLALIAIAEAIEHLACAVENASKEPRLPIDRS